MQLRLVQDAATLARGMWSGRFGVCAPRRVFEGVVRLTPTFDGGYGRQQDAHEAITSVLGHVHDALALPAAPGAEPRLGSDSAVAGAFRGVLKSQVRCGHCGSESAVLDPFFDLSLEIPRDKQLRRVQEERGDEAMTPQRPRSWLQSAASLVGLGPSRDISVDTCLHSFCTSEQLVHRDQYRCDRCRRKVDAVKMLSVERLPEVLCLHIKRFSHSSGGWFGGGSKISEHVRFPASSLDMAPFLSSHIAQTRAVARALERLEAARGRAAEAGAPGASAAAVAEAAAEHEAAVAAAEAEADGGGGGSSGGGGGGGGESTVYDLYALVQHDGGVGGGHYTAFCRHHITGEWLHFDDERVRRVSEEAVLKRQAYLLFYARRDTTGFQARMRRAVQDAINGAPPAGKPGAMLVSRVWLQRADTMVHPGPVDNRSLCCEHGVPYPHERTDFQGRRYEVGADRVRAAHAVRVSAAGWDELVRLTGGGDDDDDDDDDRGEEKEEEDGKGGGGAPAVGPPVTGERHRCAQCELPYVAEFERERVFELNDREAKRDREAGVENPAQGWYMISSSWLKEWRAFTAGKGPRPGPIANRRLFLGEEKKDKADEVGGGGDGGGDDGGDDNEMEQDDEEPREEEAEPPLPAEPLEGLRIVKHYRGLHQSVWRALHGYYGGGPEIRRATLDIYGEAPPPDQ